jgi:uncharacterized protein (DUF433 family)
VGWFWGACGATLSSMQAFDARPPPLTESPDGTLRLVGTRVTLDSVVIAFDMGATPEEIVHRYPSIDITSVYEVIAYVLRHRSGVDDYLRVREQKSVRAKVEVEARFPPDGVRARLLARRDAGGRDAAR